jgi:spore coat polysaccharide biosynthesis protein SpsF
MTTACIVQARSGSTRLPGKVLTELAGRPMLRLMLDRLAHLPVDALVVATSDLPADDPVAAVAADAGAAVVRGPEADVLARFAVALEEHRPDVVVRMTADCPLADAALVAAAVEQRHRTGADYVSNSLIRTFPDGLDVEVVTAAALREAVAEAADAEEREHVTPFVYRRPARYRLGALLSGQLLGHERWTVDTPEDLARLRAIVDRLDDPVTAGWREVLAVAGTTPRPPGLRLATPADGVGPADDPGRRVWVFDDGHGAQGWVRVTVDDGVGAVDGDVPSGAVAQVVAACELVLAADRQVKELRLPETWRCTT